MPINTKYTRIVSGYIPRAMQLRMKRIAKTKPRLNLSYQIERAMEAYLPTLEAECGIQRKPSNQRMP